MRIKVTFIIISAMMMLISNGCSRQTEINTSHPVVLKFAFWGDVRNAKLSQVLIEAFQKDYPNIKIKIIPMDAEYKQKLLTMSAGGTMLDIFIVMPDYLQEIASRGVLLDLDSYLNSDEEFLSFKEDIFPQLLEVIRFRGNAYAIPFWTNSFALFYNKNIFDREGLPYPNNTWDWDTFISAAKRLTEDTNGDGRIDQFGFIFSFQLKGTPGDIYRYIRRNGGQMFNQDKTKCLLNTPSSIESIRWCLDLINRHGVTPSPQKMGTAGLEYEKGFLSGRAAMTVSGRWSIPYFSKACNFDWSVAPEPKGKVDYNPMSTVLLGASSKTGFITEKWQFLRFIMSEKAQSIVRDLKSDIPIRISLINSPDFVNSYGKPEENKVFIDCLNYAEEFPHFLGDREWLHYVDAQLELVLLGQRELEVACQEIVDKYQKMVIEK